MDTLPGTQFTDMWMMNPWMTDPTQQSNQFSLFNNAALPFPSSYAGVPVNAATGRPIQSFLDWQKANPGGTTINSTPAQPRQPSANDIATQMLQEGLGMTPGMIANAGQQGADPMTLLSVAFGAPIANNPSLLTAGEGPTGTPAAAPQASGSPNNWQAALSALANPGNPVTPGARVPLAMGYQPAGGVNRAFLGQAAPGMNQKFLSALAAIQGRPQQGV